VAMTLYTIGYEGCDIECFVAILKKKKIELIADVRKKPISRKKGFSKNKLAARLAQDNIGYFHFKNLGVPSEWRKRAKNHEISREKMFEDYSEKILPKDERDLLIIRDIAKEKSVALLCFEADPSDCHRRRITQWLERRTRGLKISDLLGGIRPQSRGTSFASISLKMKGDHHGQ
jgi:uncharacterized protein (DUF488 family)